MTTLRSGAASLVGQVRSANEDSYLVTDDLVAVADGMGGHRAGEVASADTVEVLRDAAGSRSVQDLVAAVHRANRRIHERAADDDALRGMGTTVCVAGLVRYDDREQVAVLNVGDSRAYLMADGELTRLTEDHSLVETLVREGRISAEEAEHHPQRNVITRALGVEPLVVVDAWLLEPVDGDRLLLCSDGLFGELGEDRIAELLAEDQDPEVVARRLAAEADAAGGRDNITTVVVDVVDSGSVAEEIEGRYRRISTPAVDLSDIDDERDRTETIMAVVVPADPDGGPGSADDLGDDPGGGPDPEHPLDDEADAGTLPEESGVEGVEGVAASEGDQVPAAEPPAVGVGDAVDDEATVDTGRGSRWRTALFIVTIVAVLAVMVGALVVWSRIGWVVAADDGIVVLQQGPRERILFIGPTDVERFEDIDVASLTDADRRQVDRGRTFGSEREARAYVAGIQRHATTTTTTTTT
ncbi:MAG: Stp1/IreP family PP2C-type Ser/Thr phosphatase, partial [Gordonia sp. (in: high G+C Gram-positive bacteria)]